MSRTITVYDERFPETRRLAEHKNVPMDWTKKDILERFGIADHLCVYESTMDGRCMQRGKRYGD